MALVTLTCPHCGFSKDRDDSLLPPAGTRVNCPRCGGQFPLAIGAPPAPVEDSLPPLAAAPAKRSWTLPFAFTGNAREYFGIWIVNTLLRVVTFGIYSPWAKVRKRRYFYGNTLLDEASFDYLADPLAILKGWFIAGLFLGLYSFASRTSPIASIVMMLVFAGLYPWVVVRSRIFNLRNSCYRNIRFSFKANYDEAYQVFLWWPLLVPLTLGLLSPYVVYLQKRYLVENCSYGTTTFRFDAAPRQYYLAFLPLLILVPLALAALVGMAFLLPKGGGNPVLLAVPMAVSAVVYLLTGLYVTTALSNLTWSSTSLGRHRFQSMLRLRDLAWIYLSNALAVLCTLGLLAPWGAVRLARYRLGKLTLSGVGRLDCYLAAENEAMGATGEELGDMLGFDLGL